MNNFNPDQKTYILRSAESQEGGVGGSNQSSIPQTESEIINPAELAAEQAGENLDSESTVEGGEGREEAKPNLNIENLSSLISEAAEAVQKEKEQASFEIDPDTGLSLQGARIEELKAQLEDIQKGETSEIDNPILAERSREKEIILANLENLNTIKTGIDNQIQATGKSLEDLIKASPVLAQRLELLQSKLTEAEQTLSQYEEETTRQLLESRQLAESKLQSKLKLAQEAYFGSDAELSDRKILLEMGLQDNITNPDQLFSAQNIQQILAIYGLQEGLDRLQQLRTESNEAREQATKDKIKTDIISRVDWYSQISDLAQALNKDIEAKLQTLQTEYPDSETISEALSLQGQSRLGYLIDSGDTQLQKLAFWFSEGRGDKTEAEILAENPNFAQYVEQQTEQIYAKQKHQVEAGEIDGQVYLGSKADKKLQQEIDDRIKEQLNKAKINRVNLIQKELVLLQFDENGLDYDKKDKSMLLEKEKLRPADIDEFKSELQQAIKDGQIQFEQGNFSNSNNIIIERQQTINKQLEDLLNKMKPVVEAAGYELSSLESIPNIITKIDEDKEKAKKKLFGSGNKQAQALTSLSKALDETLDEYRRLQTEKQNNSDTFESNSQTRDKLRAAYNKLPQSIKDKLSSLENPTLDTITQAITTGVEEIQNYQTPPEITERREKIASLKSQIAETEAITALATQATT